ncbi:hypothetical protein EX895_005773 [Sporisorium graminicola]|uniref:Up-regulated during septation protein 1 domain-containing protein n=1 Tax=Sporisorium graminicola TaxID=280036 RepID=A0A4U7KMU0_9BASI|nr:hypothetical protein EX895_005773 [Sporisorium graminicola]TKY85611.1 hypothetical protein EX895_005773 [Sporisorium graminicola]
MLDVARSMARLPSPSNRWTDAPTQLVSSRLEQGARLGSTPSSSIDSTASTSRWPESSLRTHHDSSNAPPPARLERAESFMSTASASSAVFANATITKASTATIRKFGPSDAAAKPIRYTTAKSRHDQGSITPSSSIGRIGSQTTDTTEYQTSPVSAADRSHTTVTTSFDTTVRTPEDHQLHHAFTKFGSSSVSASTSFDAVNMHLAQPKSFFSDSLSGDESTRSLPTTTSPRRTPLDSDMLGLASIPVAGSRRGSDNANSELVPNGSYHPAMSRTSSYQSAMSSLANSAESLPHQHRNFTKSPAGAKHGLGIQTRGPPSTSSQIAEPPLVAARYLPGPALEVVHEARESPYLGSRASQSASTPDMRAPSALTISTSLPLSTEPIWGESSSAGPHVPTDPNFGAMASFSFPSPALTSAGPQSMSRNFAHSGSLSAKFPRSPGSAFHSSNPSIQSSMSNMNGRQALSSSRPSDAGLLQASSWSHAPPSSYGGSVISSTAGTSAMGFSSLNPNNREDMLQRLLLDQARVDCQEYGTLSLEEVAEAKRELKHVERKLQSLRTKLKVEIKIRDAAIALRKAHRTTAASANSPTSSANLAVSPTSPRFPNTLASASTSSSSSSSSFAARSRAFSISASEAKADEDVALATAKVDKVANELFKWSDRATTLRRKLLEHQAATLSERVQHLESDRQVMEEKLPFLTASASFESLAPSASASAIGIARYRDAGHRYQQSADEPYMPRGADDPLRHNRLESDLSAISGFSFLDAPAPEKLRRLGEELEKKRELVRKLELDLDSARDAARRKDQTSDRLTQQLEEQSRERSRAVEELRALNQQLSRQDELTRQAKEHAVKAATADVEQRMQKQFEQKEDALVNAKAEVMAAQRSLADIQSRLDAPEKDAKALQFRAESAERALDEHKRKLEDVQGESKRQRSLGTQDLASLQAELVAAKAAQAKSDTLARERAGMIAELEKQLKQTRSTLDAEKQTLAADHAAATMALEKQLNQLRSELSAENRRRADAEEQLTVSHKKTVDMQSRADQADSKLRELELAVGAERRIMAERDELFHAFERRLESAEKRLQEQDKRCARMLGKLEGREEMDDLLERIKAGAAGVAKKQKTAGQDIAGLLSSLETHIGDLELELARANAQISGSSRDSTTASDAPASTSHDVQLEASIKEVQKWKEEVERLEELLQSEKGKQAEAPAQDRARLQELEAEVLALSEEKKSVKLEQEARNSQLETDLQELSQKFDELEQQGKERVAQLQDKLERLEARNRDLEKQLQNTSSPASPAGSSDALPLRASKVASPLSATFPQQKKGVGNLIDRFGGGGRKVSSELRADDSPAALQACLRSAESLRAMLPDLPAAAKGSADLQALRNAFQASSVLPNSPPAATGSPTSMRSILSAASLQAELDATAERLRSTLAISRAVIDLALEADADKENRTPSERGKEQQQAVVRAEADALSSQQALVTRITSLTAKVKEQTDREKRLKAELAEVRQQLNEARSAQRVPSSPSGLTLGNDSMLGLSTSPARPVLADLLGMPKSLGRTCSNQSMRTLTGEKAVVIPTTGAASLAPPRSPLGIDLLPSPTRSNVSVYSSPSIRYISPFAPSSFEARTPQSQAAELRSTGVDDGVGNVPFSNTSSSNTAETWDSMSLRSASSPSTTHPGLPSSSVSLAGTSQSSAPTQHRTGADASPGNGATPNGMVKRTITLGMDVPQLASRVRELERQLAQTASIRQRADRVVELEAQLREANQAYSKLLDRMDTERVMGTHQKVEMLNELNDAQTKLQTTKAQIQRSQTLSPFVSPMVVTAPLPPPKE